MKQSDKAQIIKNSAIFSSLNDDELNDLAGLAVVRSLTSNEFVFWDGDTPEWFCIVAEGKVKVLKHSSSGKEFVIAFFGPGEMFGEVAVFENKPYPASAQAVTETKVVGVKKDDFLSFLANRPSGSPEDYYCLGGAAQGCLGSSQSVISRSLFWPASDKPRLFSSSSRVSGVP